jgi:CHAT domain-containing protein
MLRAQLAEKMISAGNEAERKRLLLENSKQANVKLAGALKDICYAAWTTEPVKAQKASQALKTLARLNPDKEISALSCWVSGIAELTRGRLKAAVEHLDRAAGIFFQIGREHDAAQTQVAKLIPLAMLGRYDEAFQTGEKALKIFKKYGDELATGKVEMNLGNIASRHELHRKAQKLYASAHARFLALNETGWLTMCENGLAITYSALNDFRSAEKFYTQALHRARTAKMSVTEAEIEASIGNLALFRGKFDRALKFLELSRRKYEALKMPHHSATAELEIADVYLELNLTSEAFSIYEKVTDELHKLKMQGEEARARANFGRVAVLQDEPETARKELKKSARLYVLEKNKVGAAAVKLNEAGLELKLQNYRKVLKLVYAAEKFLRQSENWRYKLTARWLAAEALRNLGKTAEAKELFLEIFADSIKNEQPNTAQSAQIALGKLAARQKNYRQAENYFKRAIRMIETLRAPLAAEEFRMAFLADKLAPFENLAKIYLAESKIEKAFLITEKARSRSLAESLGSEAQSINDGQNKISAKLAKKLEDLREELNWFYSRLNRADEAEIENLQTEAKKREKQIADVMRQIESTRAAKFGKRDFLVFDRLQKRLGKRRALIEFVNTEGNLSAFVVTDKKIHFAADLAKETEIIQLLEGLQFQFDALRYGAKSLGKHLGELKRRADFYLNKLYEKLLRPLEGFAVEERNFVIVPVGTLHYVPFHALFDGTNYLIQRREVVYSPSATVWQFLASKPVPTLKNALLMGFADERIPFVNLEIEILDGIFQKSKKFTGEKATFAAFTKNAPHFDVLHLACHGNFRPENPLFSSLHLADGWITVRDICSQNLKAEIVTLSACETGLNKIFAGDEILGLARGFLSAGASSLVLSLWTVNDEAATELMSNFYKELRKGKTAAEALKIAQGNFIARGLHPYFWSPFALIGR